MKKKSIIICIGVVLLLCATLCYKLYVLNVYNTEYFEVSKFIIEEPVNISSKTSEISDYFMVNNLMIKNDFEEFESREDINDGSSGFKTYVLYDEDHKVKAAIQFLEYVSFINGLSEEPGIFGENVEIHGNDIPDFMKSHNFETDIDLIKYLSDLPEEKMTIFTPTKKLKDNYIAHYLASAILPSGNYREITGDYSGYFINTGRDATEVNIISGEKRYVITFTKLDYFTEDYIKELISTIKY